jgi:hypothetical protein
MNVPARSNLPQRGRRPHGPVDSFQTRAWFNSIADVVGTNTPHALEQTIQRHLIHLNDGKTKASSSWDKYKNGLRLPQDGHGKDGKPGAVMAAEQHAPESGDVFRHPIWKAMRADIMNLKEATDLISTLRPATTHYYVDLSDAMASHRAASLEQNIGLAIWIDRGDYRSALDHLAAHLMILRIGIVRHLKSKRLDCAYNIAKTLGPLAASPWIGPFHEEMFDWLEANVWGNLFDELYTPQEENNAKGWRKSKPDWLTLGY